MANDINTSPLTVSMLSTSATEIARAAPKAQPVNQPAPKREETSGRSFAEELGRGHERPLRDAKESKDTRESKDSADSEKTLGGDQPKKVKETVRKAAATTRDGIDSATTVAFVSGRLEQIDPLKIPTLVADSPFISQAMMQEDIAQFMTQPTSMVDLAKNLGLPVNFLVEVQNLGLDPSQKIAPLDFFKAIGVDPQQVVAELNLLKGNILAEGMAPYLNRAAAIAAKSGKANVVPVKTGLAETPLEMPVLDAWVGKPAVDWTPVKAIQSQSEVKNDFFDKVDGALQPNFLLSAAALIAAQQNQGQQSVVPVDLKQVNFDPTATIKIEAARPETAVLSSLVRQLTGQVQEEEPATDLMSMQMAEQMGGIAMSQQPTLTMDRFAEIVTEPKEALVSDKALDLPADMRPETLIAQTPATMKKATFDAFAVMGEQLKGMDTVRFDVSELASVAADKAAAESSILYGINSPVNTSSLGNGLGAVASLAGAQVAGTEKILNNLPGKDRIESRARSNDVGAVSSAAQDGRQAAQTMAVSQSRGDNPSGQDSGGSTNQGGGQFAGDKSANDVQASRGVTQTSRGNQPQAAFATRAEKSDQGLSPQQRYQIMQKVLNHATMMVKEGGGTVRLDLGSSELGSMQMAINMNKDQVDMRVITSSDRVREAMMAELSQLKNALSVQNVRLGNVEVGVSGRQPNGFAAFDGNLGQGRGRDASGREKAEQRGIAGVKGVGNGVLRGPLRVDTGVVSNLFTNNGGKIAVRA